MAYLLHHFWTGGTEDQYRAMLKSVHPSTGLPEGETQHVAGPTDGGFLITAVWDSRGTTRCWCRGAGSGRSPGRSWPNWCRTPGSPRPPPAGEPPGWRPTTPRRTPARTRPTATCGPSPDRAPTGVALVGTGPTVAASSGSWPF